MALHLCQFYVSPLNYYANRPNISSTWCCSVQYDVAWWLFFYCVTVVIVNQVSRPCSCLWTLTLDAWFTWGKCTCRMASESVERFISRVHECDRRQLTQTTDHAICTEKSVLVWITAIERLRQKMFTGRTPLQPNQQRKRTEWLNFLGTPYYGGAGSSGRRLRWSRGRLKVKKVNNT